MSDYTPERLYPAPVAQKLQAFIESVRSSWHALDERRFHDFLIALHRSGAPSHDPQDFGRCLRLGWAKRLMSDYRITWLVNAYASGLPLLRQSENPEE